ncbi:hypothetical protein O987_07860 [Comamonas testosteroni TK102]|uniref:Structural protein MipA n=2 Tax=Comamonas TaxID=283 RepID=A0A076PG36_COMTE|nr:MipA/OmpV family protein [Comamonas testosteroni]AIJ45719.1 hypothetical protein O987_07860 [Comamonas testosteroni TK102]MPS87088.1 MipA/OmpV family protein [Comamonas sp.]
MNPLASAVTMTALVAASATVHAQSDFYRRTMPPNASEGGVAGLAVIAGHRYQGSDESRIRVLPSIEYQWSNGFFAGVMSGVGYNASRSSEMSYGARITADFGRKERRSAALRGLGDIDPRPEIGAFFNANLTSNLTLNSAVRFGSGNNRNGLLLDLGAGWNTRISPSLQFSATVATTWSNNRYAQDYFGITKEQAINSGYAEFAPGSGLRDVRLGTSVIYRMNPKWSLVGSLVYSELIGDARNSPIVRQKGSLSSVIALGYNF